MTLLPCDVGDFSRVVRPDLTRTHLTTK